MYRNKSHGSDLYKHTRHGLTYRRRIRLAYPTKTDWDKHKSINERPSIVEKKIHYGDFEMDTLVGKSHKGAILTLVDRLTGYTIINELPMGKCAKPLACIVNKRLAFIKRRGLLLSITTDNGTEFTAFKSIERSLFSLLDHTILMTNLILN